MCSFPASIFLYGFLAEIKICLSVCLFTCSSRRRTYCATLGHGVQVDNITRSDWRTDSRTCIVEPSCLTYRSYICYVHRRGVQPDVPKCKKFVHREDVRPDVPKIQKVREQLYMEMCYIFCLRKVLCIHRWSMLLDVQSWVCYRAYGYDSTNCTMINTLRKQTQRLAHVARGWTRRLRL